MEKKIAFVSGVARSGTSALVNMLNVHDNILIGQERFYFRIEKNEIKQDFFEKKRFLSIQPGDTHNSGGLSGSEDVRAKKYDSAAIIGDKSPNLFERFPYIFSEFPDAYHIYILRNPFSVVESYNARYEDPQDSWNRSFQDGLRDWNASVNAVAELTNKAKEKFIIIEYENVFKFKQESDKIFEFLGVTPAPEEHIKPIRDRFQSLNEGAVARRDDIRLFVSRNADWRAYNRLFSLME